jgi:uncharacterized protein YjbJ (UPF0337 family)
VKQQILIAPLLAVAALASGCASWDAHDRGNDYQCGYAGSIEGPFSAFTDRQDWAKCRADYAADAVAHEIITKGNAMNWDMIEGNWKQFQGRVKAKWGRLTDDNLDLIAGKRDQLSGQIQESYGITKDQAERQLKLFEQIHKDFQPKSLA